MRALTLICILLALSASSQEAFVVDNGQAVHVANGASISFFGDVVNRGNLSLSQGARTLFLGRRWTNAPTGSISDSTLIGNSNQGGTIRFQQPNPLFGNQGLQFLDGGHDFATGSGTRFTGIELDNPNGLSLLSGTAVLDRIHFVQGNFLLNDHDLTIGDGKGHGLVDNYSSSNYFITNSNWNRGFLRMVNPFADSFSFPVGSGSYMPIRFRQVAGVNGAYYAKSVPNSYTGGISGTNNRDSTTGNTWVIGGDGLTAKAGLTVHAQHGWLDEGSLFHANRQTSYLSIYRNGWDKAPAVGSPLAPGFVTSAVPGNDSYTNPRGLELTPAAPRLLLQKKVLPKGGPVRIPNAFSPNGDMVNDTWDIPGLVAYPQCTVEVFNRWGQQVYYSRGYALPWNGTYHNSRLPVATYYYIIQLEADAAPLSGYVVILK